jgi:hypothetical protein
VTELTRSNQSGTSSAIYTPIQSTANNYRCALETPRHATLSGELKYVGAASTRTNSARVFCTRKHQLDPRDFADAAVRTWVDPTLNPIPILESYTPTLNSEP